VPGIRSGRHRARPRVRSLAALGPQQAGRTIISSLVQRAPTAMFLLVLGVTYLFVLTIALVGSLVVALLIT